MKLKFMSVLLEDQEAALRAYTEVLGFQKCADIPATAFITSDIHAEVTRLKGRGVRFRGEPAASGPIIAVRFEDGCGNLINLVQPPAG